MTITLFGALVLLIGCWLLLRAAPWAMLAFVMLASLMSGSAAFVLTGLGGSTVPPASAALPFLLLRCLLPGGFANGQWAGALRENVWLLAFVLYGSLGAYLLPRIFAGQVDVTPLRPIPTGDPFVTFPLAFSPQNVTVSVYLLLTLTAALCSFLVASRPGNATRIARVAAVVAATHAGLGFASVAFAGTPLAALLDFFRNGFYAQLDQTVSGFVRMNGIAPEPSGYAIFGFAYCVFTCELWARGVEKAWTRPAALLMLAALFVSTSSTAYVGLIGYGAVWLGRMLLAPARFSGGALLALVGTALVGAIGLVLTLLLVPELAETVGRIVDRVLFDKGDSLSGMQRMAWALQGFEAFRASAGLGIGMGSFRSSSLVTAILGSAGVIGIAAFALHLVRVFGPLRASTYAPGAGRPEDVGIAAAWTALIMLIPAAVTAASPDPGLNWGLMGGIALALRQRRDAGEVSAQGRAGGYGDMKLSQALPIGRRRPAAF